MEDGLGDGWALLPSPDFKYVLILVLVEDGLGDMDNRVDLLRRVVLILVLVEDGLGASTLTSKRPLQRAS